MVDLSFMLVWLDQILLVFSAFLIHFSLGLVYTTLDYFSCRITFLNQVQNTLRSMSVYAKPGNSPVTLFRAKITSLHLAYLLFPLPIFSKQSMNLICTEAIILTNRGLGAFRIGLRCLRVKQNGTDCTGSIFVPPADAEQSGSH